jgi:hypothetical protein
MTPDELLTHLEAELARCRDERDRISGELELTRAERDGALLENARAERMLLAVQAELDAAEAERDRLFGELDSLLRSKSWLVTRPLRSLLGSDRPEAVDAPASAPDGAKASPPAMPEAPAGSVPAEPLEPA